MLRNFAGLTGSLIRDGAYYTATSGGRCCSCGQLTPACHPLMPGSTPHAVPYGPNVSILRVSKQKIEFWMWIHLTIFKLQITSGRSFQKQSDKFIKPLNPLSSVGSGGLPPVAQIPSPNRPVEPASPSSPAAPSDSAKC